ncbi:MAG TPA: hypothetical protein VIZ17_17370 [Acetobacteraceae bacterium]
MRITTALAGAIVALSATPLYLAHAQYAPATKLALGQKAPYGKYLTDGNGRALYMFTADKKGRSTCDSACAEAWPPLTSGGQVSAGAGLIKAKIGHATRVGGEQQVTYNGMPLYYFARDQTAGSAAGEDIKAYGGTWYLVSPAGQKIDVD